MHPKKLGRYELVSVLGKGAMGVVYEARDPNLDRRVAIKTIMVDDLAPTAASEYEERFRTEARSAARLQHPNIVSVYDSDRDGDTAFLVMEFVQGEDLKRHLDRGERFSAPDALKLVLDLLAALDLAHAQGVVHRDIKPANLLIEPGGQLKLTDFGVARITGEATRTQGSMVGTLKYMAPEQVQGQKVDVRADQFSAAVVAYQLFTGQRPFDGDNDFSIIHQIIGQVPPPPSTLVPGLPPALDGVLARAMAKQRDDRYPRTAEFAAALQAAFAQAGIQPSVQVAVPATAGRPAVPSRAPTLPPPTLGGAPITQELELEYWRAVRDSQEPAELEGFLRRFPEGIYADLARRRLERLGAEPDPDRTVLQGMTRPPQSPDPRPAEPPLPMDDPDATVVGTRPRRPAPVVAEPPPSRSGRWTWGAPGLVAVAAALAAGWWLQRSPDTPAAAAVPAVAAVAPAPVASAATGTAGAPTDPPAKAASAAVAAAPAATARPAASAAARASRRAEPPPAAVAAPAAPARPAVAAPAEPRREAAGAQPATGSRATAAASPDEVCKDRNFLSKQLCLQTECGKPEHQRAAACVHLRELREERPRY